MSLSCKHLVRDVSVSSWNTLLHSYLKIHAADYRCRDVLWIVLSLFFFFFSNICSFCWKPLTSDQHASIIYLQFFAVSQLHFRMLPAWPCLPPPPLILCAREKKRERGFSVFNEAIVDPVETWEVHTFHASGSNEQILQVSGWFWLVYY